MSLNGQTTYLCHMKPTNNEFCEQLLYLYAKTISKCLWLQDGSGLQLEKLGLKLFPRVFKNRYQWPWFVFPANQGYIFLLMFKENVLSGLSWLPLISKIIWAKNLGNHRDRAL